MCLHSIDVPLEELVFYKKKYIKLYNNKNILSMCFESTI